MKLLRLVCYGAVALWGITRDASSCSNDERVGRQTELDVGELDTEAVGDGDVQIVNSTADDDETNAGGTAPMDVSKGDDGEGGSADHGHEKQLPAIVDYDWPMTPASFDDHVGEHAVCAETVAGPNDTQDGDVEDDESTEVVQHTTVTGSTNHDNDDIGSTGAIEPLLRLKKKWTTDPFVEVVLSPGLNAEPPSIRMTEIYTMFDPQVFPPKKSWTFIAQNRAQRDEWITTLIDAMEQTGDTANADEADVVPEAAAFAIDAGNPSDFLDFKTRYLGMQPRKVTLSGSTLTMCKMTKDGRRTKSCQELILGSDSDAMPIASKKHRKRKTQALFRVTTDSSGSAKSWTFDAGSPKEQARWISLIKGSFREARDDEDTGERDDEANSSYKGKSMQQRLKGQKLGPNDPPLEPGMFLTNFNEDYPTTLEVTETGDILITAGFFPNSTQDTLWEHRSTGPSGVHALGCALEAFWQRARKGGETRVSLSIKNGRWRVGRGKMCTLARSPAPEGSLRRFLPWDERGKAVIEASLYMVRNGHATIFSGTEVMWSSFLEMIKAKEDEGMGE